MNYNEEFERAYSQPTRYKPVPGWTKFFTTNKEHTDKETGFLRLLYDSRVNEIRKQIVFEKNGKYKIADIEIEMGEDKLDTKFYPLPFDTVEDAMFALKTFTVDGMFGVEFDKNAYQIYRDLMERGLPSADVVSIIKENQYGDTITYEQKPVIMQEAIDRLYCP